MTFWRFVYDHDYLFNIGHFLLKFNATMLFVLNKWHYDRVFKGSRDAKPVNLLVRIESLSLLTKYEIDTYESRAFESRGYKWLVTSIWSILTYLVLLYILVLVGLLQYFILIGKSQSIKTIMIVFLHTWPLSTLICCRSGGRLMLPFPSLYSII